MQFSPGDYFEAGTEILSDHRWGKTWGNLAGRCCDFALDEKLCEVYCSERFPDSYDKGGSTRKPSIKAALVELQQEVANGTPDMHTREFQNKEEGAR